MRTNLPFIYEGEILDVAPQDGVTPFVRYLCRVEMDNGSHIIVTNVESATMFGGIADYTQMRARTTQDSGRTLEVTTQANENARVGDRVLITFIGGSLTRPIIIGHMQHPNQTIEISGSEAADLQPNAVFQYAGMRITIDETGQLQIVHKGAPEIKFVEKDGGVLGDLLGTTGGATEALGSASSNPFASTNDAVVDADEAGITILEMLDDGVFRVRDSDGQIIEMDRTKNRIYISNNDLKSTEDASGGPASGGNQLESNSTDAEYVLLDSDKKLVLINARSIAQIYSADKRKDVTKGDHSHKIGGGSTWTISGDEMCKIDGDQKISTEGDRTIKVGGDNKGTINGGFSIAAEGGVLLDGNGGQLKLSGGKVALGGKGVELLDLFDKTLQQLDTILKQIQTLTVPTAVGPSGPPINAAAFSAADGMINTIKESLSNIKGSL